jgi:CBS domain-containing protein
MRVQDIMTNDPVTVAPDAPFKEVVERMVRREVSSLPVVDAQGSLVGLISEADLICKEAYGGTHRRAIALLAGVFSARDHHWVTKAEGSDAAAIMTRRPVVCRPHEDVRTAARRMVQRGVKHMPVVQAGTVIGIVSRHDVLKMFDRPDDEIATEVHSVLSQDANMPDDFHIRSSVHQGVVQLVGDVRYAWDVAIVVSKLREIPGVVGIDCRLRHRERNPQPPAEPWIFGRR